MGRSQDSFNKREVQSKKEKKRKEKEKKLNRQLAAEYARISKELLKESPKFKRLTDIKIKLEM